MSYATRTISFLSVLDALAYMFRGQEKIRGGEDEGLDGETRQTHRTPAHDSENTSFAPRAGHSECRGRTVTEPVHRN